MKVFAFGLGLTVLVAASSYTRPARAADPAPSGEPAEEAEEAPVATSWYGWQTLIADVPAAGLTVAALTQIGAGKDGSLLTGLLGTAIPLFVLAPPLVHVAHERWGAFGGDVALRGAVAAVSLGLGFLGSIQNQGPCPGQIPGHCVGPLPVGTSIGIVAALSAVAAVDAGFLAREPATAGTAPARSARASWSPVVGVTPGGGGSVAIAGAF